MTNIYLEDWGGGGGGLHNQEPNCHNYCHDIVKTKDRMEQPPYEELCRPFVRIVSGIHLVTTQNNMFEIL